MGLILLKKAGHVVPQAYLQKVLAEKPTIMGMAAACKKNEKETELRLGSTDGFDLNFILQGMEEQKGIDMLMYFGEKALGHEKQINCQPYQVLSDGNGDPLILAMVEGNFDKFKKDGSKLPPEFFVAYEYLQPKLQDFYEASGKDLNGVLDRMSRNAFKMDLENTFSVRGVVALLAANGTLKTFSKNDQRGAFPWGSTTKHLGFKTDMLNTDILKEEPPKTEAPKPVEEKKAFFSAMAPKPPAAPAEPEQPTEVDDNEKKEDTQKTAGVTQQSTVYMIFPPAHESSRNKLRKFYGKWLKRVPDNFAERPGVAVSKVDYDKYGGPKEATTNGSTTSVPSVSGGGYKSFSELPVEQRDKDTAPKHIRDRTVGSEAPLATPVLSARAKEQLATFLEGETVKTILDSNSKVILDPKLLHKLEKDIPSFAEQCGLDGLEDTFKWPYEILISLCAKHPEAAAVLLMNYRTTYLKTLSEGDLQKINKPAEEPVQPDVTNPEAPQQDDPPKKVAAGGGISWDDL